MQKLVITNMLEVGSTSNIVVSSRFWLKCIATLRNSSNFALASIGVNKVSIWTHRKIVNAMYLCAEMVWAIIYLLNTLNYVYSKDN
jgi:hypothetical protein